MSVRERPWLKWYPADWRADPMLRNCGLAARGLWMEMLALMHESERYGYLLVNGKPPSDRQLAIQCGALFDEVPSALAELESEGVFSRDRNGVIYSRRMIRDEKKAEHARKIGKKGGNPSLSKQKDNSEQDNRSDKRQDNGGVKAQRPEARKKPKGFYAREIFESGWTPEPFGEGSEAASIIASWPDGEFKRQFERFRDHHKAKGSRFDDWQAAWGTWVRNSVTFGQQRRSSDADADERMWERMAEETRRYRASAEARG